MPPDPSHSKRCMPKYGRSSSRPAAAPRRRAEDHHVPLTRKTSQPPGRSRRAPRDPAVRVGPDGRAVLGDREVEALVRSGTSSALASSSGKSRPNSACIRRAVSSWAGVMSTRPAARPPREPGGDVRRPAAELDVSIPATSGSARSSDSGTCQTPHVELALAHARGAHSANSARTRSRPSGCARRWLMLPCGRSRSAPWASCAPTRSPRPPGR
jgi:hypothetical protein